MRSTDEKSTSAKIGTMHVVTPVPESSDAVPKKGLRPKDRLKRAVQTDSTSGSAVTA
jgi:hypothetical protein